MGARVLIIGIWYKAAHNAAAAVMAVGVSIHCGTNVLRRRANTPKRRRGEANQEGKGPAPRPRTCDGLQRPTSACLKERRTIKLIGDREDDPWPGQPRPSSRSALASKSTATCRPSSDPDAFAGCARRGGERVTLVQPGASPSCHKKSPAQAGLFL
jgi:hypothetical protein